ncbi:MAG: hypothetical protein DCF20_01215 [Pseudanabaena sp.]|nr:MAG: hypothetical protein DCF20_01215 [Pseudanabaena sp.]
MHNLESIIQSAKVLIVEDETIISWCLQESLEALGYQVSAVVSSGKKAIDAAVLVKPDIALMDIRLKGEMDGIEAADFLYRNFDIPIIYLTAHSDENILKKAIQTSPFGYLLKPFAPKELHCTIQIALQRHQSESRLSEFISIASHELKTPLTSIHGALGLLASGVLANQSDTAKRMLDIASSDTERLVRLVNDILDLERLESNKVTLNRQWHDAAELCQQAIATMQTIAAESQIAILSNLKSLKVFADSDRIIQTLVNLLSNAIKFSPPQSQVQIEVEQIADEIVFRVCDRGCGIPKDRLESIFERFNQVDISYSSQKGGTGLGLAICRSIIQQHGGKIWVESVLSEGSTVSFTIPYRDFNNR